MSNIAYTLPLDKFPDFPAVEGSTTGMTYRALATVPGTDILLSAKPVIISVKKFDKVVGTFVGLKVRSSRATKDAPGAAVLKLVPSGIADFDPPKAPDDPAGCWPKIEWKRANSSRASGEWGMILPRSLHDHEAMTQGFEQARFFSKLMTFLGSAVADHGEFIQSAGAVSELLRTWFDEALKNGGEAPLNQVIDPGCAIQSLSAILHDLMNASEAEQKAEDSGLKAITGGLGAIKPDGDGYDPSDDEDA